MATTTYSFELINGPDTVNIATNGDQFDPELANRPDGSATVFFQNGDGISARGLDASGEPVGSEINLLPPGYDVLEDVTTLANGNAVVLWRPSGGGVLARIYTPDLQQVGATITVFADSAQYHQYAHIAAKPDGGFVVVASQVLSGTNRDVFLRSYDASGSYLTGASYTEASYDYAPSVAVQKDGNIALAWVQRDPSTLKYQIWTAVYSSTMAVIKAPAAINTLQTNNNEPHIVANPDGTFLLSYIFGSSSNVYAEVLSATGVVIAEYYVGLSTPTFFVGNAVSPAGHAVTLMEYYGAGTSDITVTLLLPDQSLGPVVHDRPLAGGPGGQMLADGYWVNNYTFQLGYSALGSPGSDGIGYGVAAARYLVVRTTTGDNSNETLIGDELLDRMTGGGGDDMLNGGGGPDTMRGGAGNDTYQVDNGGDVVDEVSPGSDGSDTVIAFISYTLGTDVEALQLSGTAAINGTGNALANSLIGNAAANVLNGSFLGDLMRGLGGNDVYVVDDAGDVVDEIAPGSGGYDSVLSSVDHELGPNLEALTLTGTGKIDGKGNGLGNTLFGNGAINKLSGGGGDDLLRGGGGKDTIDGGGGSDTADYSDMAKAVQLKLDGSKMVSVKIGGKSEDQLKNVENVTGGLGKDKLVGDGKANTLDGLLGKDTLSGGAGKDKFLFDTGLGSDNADSITDFKHKQDKLALDDAIFSAIGVKLDKAEFYAKAGARKAHDASDRIVYDSSTGKLYYDDDGKGGHAPLLVATLTSKPLLTIDDFSIV